MNFILIAVIVLGAIALVASVVLYAVSKKFAVKEDPRIGQVLEVLPGAALLCTKAAFATGCGYIRLMTAEENKKLVLSVPEVVFQPRQEEEIAPMLQFASCLAIGPGIGTSEETKLFLI